MHSARCCHSRLVEANLRTTLFSQKTSHIVPYARNETFVDLVAASIGSHFLGIPVLRRGQIVSCKYNGFSVSHAWLSVSRKRLRGLRNVVTSSGKLKHGVSFLLIQLVVGVTVALTVSFAVSKTPSCKQFLLSAFSSTVLKIFFTICCF